ncbi:hypothetical protein [Streptosporangium saharense]|uniref:hypothetical protein n=1 Tax=Streptosporangium saharense TaxID=1706840 RepID=UPI00343BED5B
MILVEIQGFGRIAVTDDLPEAAYVEAGRLTATRTASRTPAFPARVVVEVLRRFGGHAPRALLGARFVPGMGTNTTFEVTYAADDRVASCPSMLWNQPYEATLSSEFASAVLDGLVEGAGELPAGLLRVDRAGTDEVAASDWVFGQAAEMLRTILSATLRDADIEAELRSLAARREPPA